MPGIRLAISRPVLRPGFRVSPGDVRPQDEIAQSGPEPTDASKLRRRFRKRFADAGAVPQGKRPASGQHSGQSAGIVVKFEIAGDIEMPLEVVDARAFHEFGNDDVRRVVRPAMERRMDAWPTHSLRLQAAVASAGACRRQRERKISKEVNGS